MLMHTTYISRASKKPRVSAVFINFCRTFFKKFVGCGAKPCGLIDCDLINTSLQHIPTTHPYNTSFKKIPVNDPSHAATSSGVPQITICPPAPPPSGPRSIT